MALRTKSLRAYFLEKPPSSIVVVRTDRVGDLILSTPFLQSLRLHFPKAKITLWVSPYCESILAHSGLVDEIVTAKPAGSFELAVGLAPRSECLKQVRATGAPVRVGYVYQGRPLVRLLALRCLTHHEVIRVEPPVKVDHEVKHLDRLARLIGMPDTTRHRLYLRPPGPTHDWLVLHLGDRWFQNGWTVDHVVRLGYGLEAMGRLVVTAGPREAELLKGGAFDEFDLRVNLNFSEWCDLIGGARLLVSPDTGAVHVAAALNTPTVVAYEESTFAHCSVQWAPWKIPYEAIVKGEPEKTLESIFLAARRLLER